MITIKYITQADMFSDVKHVGEATHRTHARAQIKRKEAGVRQAPREIDMFRKA
jgi:hypothetical protein